MHLILPIRFTLYFWWISVRLELHAFYQTEGTATQKNKYMLCKYDNLACVLAAEKASDTITQTTPYFSISNLP